MKQKLMKQFFKRGLSMTLSIAVALTLLPVNLAAATGDAAEENVIKLWEGGSYTMPYNTSVSLESPDITLETPDAMVSNVSPIAAVEIKEGEETTLPALHNSSLTDDGTGYKDRPYSQCFNAADSNLDIRDAEMTITKADGADTYKVYSEGLDLYFSMKHPTGKVGIENTFTKGDFAIRIYKDAANKNSDRTTFNIQAHERSIFFYLPRKCFDGQGYANNVYDQTAKPDIQGEFTFLRKMTAKEMEEKEAEDIDWTDTSLESLVPGYRVAKSIVSGGKYLIGHKWANEAEGEVNFGKSGIVIFYPTIYTGNVATTKRAFTKLVYGERTVKDPGSVVIKGKRPGTTYITVDGVRYTIQVLAQDEIEVDEEITIPKGGKRFFRTDNPEDATSLDPSVVTFSSDGDNGKGEAPALYDAKIKPSGTHTLEQVYEMRVPNWSIDMRDAELVVTQEGENYSIFSEYESKYLVNLEAKEYFSETKVLQKLTKVAGEDSFDIQRQHATSKNGRYVYFHYPFKGFDGYSDRSSKDGDYGMEFLEKKDIKSDADLIPGYQRVGKITSGKKYLITNIYHDDASDEDVIIVLYPKNGFKEQNKMFKMTEVTGITIEGKGENGQSAILEIDNKVYRVTIGACKHEEYRLEGEKLPTCTEKGDSGKKICLLCGEAFEEGGETDALGHEYGEPVVTEASREEDGESVKTCERCGDEQRETVQTSEEFVEAELDTAIATAEGKEEADYTPTSWANFQEKLTQAREKKESGTKAERIAATDALLEAMDKLEDAAEYAEKQTELNTAKSNAAEKLAQTDVYTADSLKSLQDALDAANALENPTLQQLIDAARAINTAISKLKTLEDEAKENLINELEDLLVEAESLIDNTEEKEKYTTESWAAFEEAFNRIYDENLNGLTADELQALLDELTVKMNVGEGGLVLKGQGGDNPGGDNPGGDNSGGQTPGPGGQTPGPGGVTPGPGGVTPGPGGATLQDGATQMVGDMEYKVVSAAAKTVTIIKGSNAAKVTIPATVRIGNEECKVVAIGDGAFSGRKKLKKITIGANVESIGKKAFFNCKKLSSVIFKGSKMPKLGKQAFKKGSSKVAVKLPKSLKKQKKAISAQLKKAGMSKKVKVK